MPFTWLRNSSSLKDFFKSNIYLMRLAHTLLENFDIFLPLERDYEIVGFLPRSKSQIILDIGAHKGESVRSFRKFDASPIFSIEANPAHESDLMKLKKRIKDFEYKIALAIAPGRQAKLYVPKYQGQELTVWSSVDETAARKIFKQRSCLKNLDSCLNFEVVTSPSVVLDDLNLDPFFIKIDVEGGEAQVLEGLKQTLARSYPVLMIENNDQRAVAEILEPLGYQAYVYEAGRKKFISYAQQGNLNLIYISSNSAHYDELLRYIN